MMNTTSIPTGLHNMAGVLNSGCGASLIQAPTWEYKVAILAANPARVPLEIQQQFQDGLGKRGWIFVSENQGIVHFKRLKRPGARA